MAVSHVWTVTELVQKNDGSGIVRSAKFTVASSDDVTSTSITRRGQVEFEKPFGAPLVRNPGFIEYVNLAHSNVLSWIQAELGPNLGNYEINNQAYIDSIDNPPTPKRITSTLPW